MNRPHRHALLGDLVVPGLARALMWLWTVFNLAVVAWVVVSSVKDAQDIFDHPFALPASPQWENYLSAWNASGFGTAALTSLVVVTLSALLIVCLSAPAAYALSRVRRRSAAPLTAYFALGVGIPYQAVLVPLFLVGSGLDTLMTDWVTGWWDARITLALVYVVLSLPFSVYLLTGYFRTLPAELEEAAALDGCGPLRTFLQIMVPLARGGLTTALLLNVVGLWNETLLVLVLVDDPEQRTLPAALINLYNTMQYTSDWGGLFAGVAILVLPMVALYLWVGRRIVDGMTQGIGK